MKKNRNQSSFLKFNYFSKLLLFFIFIIAFLAVTFILSSQFYLKYLQSRVEERTIINLKMLGDKIDEVLIDSYNESSNYIWSNDLDEIRFSINPLEDFKDGCPLLGAKARSFLQSIYYVDNKFEIVIGKHGIEKKSDFFKYHYPYLKEDNIMSMTTDKFEILPYLTIFKINDLTSTGVMPFMIKDIKRKENDLIINLSEDKIFQLLKTFTINSNAHLFIMDAQGYIRSFTDRQNIYTPEIYKKITDDSFIKNVRKGESFYSSYFGNKRLVIQCQSKRSTVQKLYYVYAIPLSELYKQSMPLSIITITISFLSLCFALFLSFLFSKNLYSPIKKIASAFNYYNKDLNKEERDELSFISSQIFNLFNDRKRLSEDLTRTMPIVVENYIYRILNEEGELIEEDFYEIIKENKSMFKYDYFTAAIVLLNFNNNFYERFSRQNEMEILKNTYSLIKKSFSKDNEVHLLNIAKNEICIIINSESNQYKEIIQTIKNIHEIYKDSNNYLELFTGIGSTGIGISSLKKTYEEALNAVSSISPFGIDRIKIYEERVKENDDYHYSINEENQLFNYLIGGFEKESRQLFNKIIEDNKNKEINLARRKDIYLQLYYTALRALNRMMINPKELLKESYIDLSNEYKKMSVEAIYLYLLKLYDKIIAHSKRDLSCKINIESVVDYINNNFNNDICLEHLSDQFKISQSHLSRLLKDYLNMSFQQYLNNIRIKKAKYLLTESNMHIEEISGECGFNSRFTFIKMFKKLEGITPTEYRTINVSSMHLSNKKM